VRDIITVVSEICSVLGFIISLFIASKLIRNSRSNNNNHGEIFQGEGDPMIAKDHSAVNHSSVIHNEFKDSVIVGEPDIKPVLTESEYPIAVSNVIKYRQGIPDIASEMVSAEKNNIIISANFQNCNLKDSEVNFIGYCIKSLPLKDWRSFIDEEYSLSFDFNKTGTIDEFYVEFKNCAINKKIINLKISPQKEKQSFVLNLKDFQNFSEDWKSVDEMCIVFIPNSYNSVFGTLTVSDLKISKI